MATREAARRTISTVVEFVASGTIEVGAATPVVAPLCVALLKAKSIIDGANRNKEELGELYTWCDLITVHVIDKAKTSNISTSTVAPLEKCVHKLEEVAERYRSQRPHTRLVLFRKNGDDIQKLRARILAVVPIMGLAGVVDLLVRLHLFLPFSLSVGKQGTRGVASMYRNCMTVPALHIQLMFPLYYVLLPPPCLHFVGRSSLKLFPMKSGILLALPSRQHPTPSVHRLVRSHDLNWHRCQKMSRSPNHGMPCVLGWRTESPRSSVGTEGRRWRR